MGVSVESIINWPVQLCSCCLSRNHLRLTAGQQSRTKSDKVGQSQNFKKFSQELKAMKLRSLHEGTGRPCSPAVGCIRHVHLARNV